MPKTVINYPSYSYPFGLALSLHWDNNGTVQWSAQFNVDELAAHLTKLQKDSPTDKRSIILSEPLSRPEMQRLIKEARRARDAAYGADE